MARPELILIFLLQYTAAISGDHDLYYRVGNYVILPCDVVPSSETRCSFFSWSYERNTVSQGTFKVVDGNIDKNLRGADRLSLNRKCSLIINNITAEDAGRYVCQTRHSTGTFLHLNILTISPSPPDADPKTDEEVTLKCSLLRYNDLDPCPRNSIRWVYENETVLVGEGDGFKSNGQTGCDSLLTVKHQSGYNRRFTCQFIERNIVKIDAHYTPVFRAQDTQVPGDTTIIVVGVVVGMLVLLVVIAAVLIKCRRRTKVTEVVQKPTQTQDEPGSNLTYVTIDHANHNPKKRVKVKEEAVTYSTVKTTVTMEADSDPSSFYSSVR